MVICISEFAAPAHQTVTSFSGRTRNDMSFPFARHSASFHCDALPSASLRGTMVPTQSRCNRRGREIATSFSRRTHNDSRERTHDGGSRLNETVGKPEEIEKTLTGPGDMIYSIGQLQRGRRACKVLDSEQAVRLRQCTGGVHPRLVFESPS